MFCRCAQFHKQGSYFDVFSSSIETLLKAMLNESLAERREHNRIVVNRDR
jgi:hypothetical protein